MGLRMELQNVFEELLGNKNVYFQPPETIKLRYPCIIYERAVDDTKHADDGLYFHKRKYSVMLIDSDPDSVYPDKLIRLPYCSQSGNPFTRDNLNHYNYNIYF